MAGEIGYARYLSFAGGRNDTFSDLALADDEGAIFHNVNLDRDGAVSKRKGATKFDATQVNAGSLITLLTQFRPTGGTAEILAAAGAHLKKWANPGWTDLYAALTADLPLLSVPFKNLLYLNNGTDVPLVYSPQVASGSKVWRAGVPRPASALTFNADIAGSIAAGTITARVRYVSPTDDSFVGEPDVDTGTVLTVSASGGVRINIPVFAGTDFRVAKRVIERTIVGGGIFYIDGYVNDNTATTYDLTQSDAALLGNDIGPDIGSRNPPPTLWPFTRVNQRVIGYDPANFGKIVWSEIDEFGILPEAFPDANYIYIEVEDQDDVPVACQKFGQYVVFYCGRSTHLVTVDDGGQGYQERVAGENPGITSPRGVVELPFGHLLWTYKGPYLFDAQTFVPIGERIESFWKTVDPLMLSNLWTVHRYDRKQVKFILGATGASRLNTAAVYHYRRASLNPEGMPVGHAWTIHDGFEASTGLIARDRITKKDVEYSGDYSGYVWIEDVTDADQRATANAIVAEFQTKWLDAGQPDFVKFFIDAWVVMQREGAGQVTCQWETDFGGGPSGSATLEITQGAAIWDTAQFDVDVFAGGLNEVLHIALGQDGVGAYGKYIRFRFDNDVANAPFTILGIVLKWQLERDRNDA